MFKIKNECSCCKYDVNFLDILEPFIDLSKEILQISNKEAELVDIIDFKIINSDLQSKIDRNKKDKTRLKKEIAKRNKNLTDKRSELTKNEEEYERLKYMSLDSFEKYMNRMVFNKANLENLNKTDILFILKLGKIIVSAEDRCQNHINYLLSKFGVINNFQTLLKGEFLKSATNNFKKFDKMQYYQTNDQINIEKLNVVYCPIIEFCFIDQNKIETDFCEIDDIWINVKQIKKKFNIDVNLISSVELIKLKDSNRIIGVRIDDYFLSVDFDVKSIICDDKLVDFYWLMIKRDVYRQEPKKISNSLSAFLQSFNSATRMENFINSLSHLKKNLYLHNQIIEENFDPFFDSVISISELKYIEDFEFYVPDFENEEKSILGIYKEYKKPNEKFYNLIHWVTNKDNNNYNHFHEESPKPQPKRILKALKPEISFYFRSKFFEDYLESILKELELEYASNYKVILKDGNAYEIDFLVNVGSCIYFIEAKTKLSSYYIEGYENKCNKILSELSNFEGNIKFLIVSAFSDKNCEQYKYFIDKSLLPNLNRYRENLETKTYHFNIPIQSHANQEITCISEPVYANLKKIISEICQ